jgi:hypothetical protein
MKSRTPESRFTRRQFLQTTTLAGMAVPFVLPSGLRAAASNIKLIMPASAWTACL